MKSALYHVFRKNLIIIIAVIACFGYAKYAVRPSVDGVNYEVQLDRWIEDIQPMTDEEAEAFINQISDTIMTDQRVGSVWINAFRELSASFENRQTVQQQILFAETGESDSSVYLPKDFLDNLDLYRELSPPSVINKYPLERYFSLQKNSIVILLSVLLFAVYMGRHYEAEMHKLSGITQNGAKYHRSLRLILISLSLAMLAVNEVVDLYLSGLMSHAELFGATLQSYSAFRGVMMDITVGQGLILLGVVKALSLLFFCFGTELAAKYGRSVKNAVIAAAVGFMAVISISMTAVGTEYGSLWNLGVFAVGDLLEHSVRIPWLGCSTFTLGVLITFVLTAVLLLWLLLSECKRHRSFRRMHRRFAKQ